MIHSIYYHNPSTKGFERMLKYLHARKYTFLSIEQLYKTFNSKQKTNDKYVIISFDDGWKGNLELIPIIEKYNVPITIFVAIEPLYSGNYWWEFVAKERGYEKMFEFKELPYEDFYSQLSNIKNKIGDIGRSSMTVDELKDLAKHPLVSIQSHTINHPILTNVPDDVLDMELRESKLRLEELTGKEVFAFSYPNGSLSQREIIATKKYYKLAFTTEQNNISSSNDLSLLPRYALTGNYFRDLLKMYGIWKWIKRLLKR